MARGRPACSGLDQSLELVWPAMLEHSPDLVLLRTYGPIRCPETYEYLGPQRPYILSHGLGDDVLDQPPMFS